MTIKPLLWGQPDPKALMRQSIANYEHSWREGMQFGYTQTDITADDGKHEVEVAEVIPLEGTPYERLVGKDGQALSSDEQNKEQRKYENEARKRHEESSSERDARIRKYEKQRDYVTEIPDAYDFALVGEESVSGRPAWVVTLTPRPGFVPATSHGEMLKPTLSTL